MWKFRLSLASYQHVPGRMLTPLCLSLFDWAYYRKMKGAIKIHTVLDYNSCLPVFIRMTDGKTRDIEISEKLALPKGSILAIVQHVSMFALLYFLIFFNVNDGLSK